MNLSIRLAVLIITALITIQATVRADDYSAPARRLARAAAAAGLKRVAVLELGARGGVSADEAEYAAGRFSAGLCDAGGVQVVERALLEGLLGERRLEAAAGPAGDPGELLRADAAVSGSVFPDKGGIKVALRLVELATGRVLAAAEVSTERRYAADEWRDAPAAPAGDCGDRRAGLDRLNAGAADLKARYWATRIKEPGFSYASLRRNLGSELRDTAVRAEFMRLLVKYGRPGAAAPLGAADLERLKALLTEEEIFYDECGL